MELLYINWTNLKSFVDSRNLSIQWIIIENTYRLRAYDGMFGVDCSIPIDGNDDQIDFETNYKTKGNQSPTSQVVTQFEKRDKTLKLAHGFASVGSDSTATILLKIPGTPGSSDGRWISSGLAFFDTVTPGDLVQSVRFTDEDNIRGQGAGYIVGSYTDDDIDEVNQGWAIPPVGTIKADAIGGYGFAPAGFYIKIVGKKANNITTGTFFVNLEWGKVE